MSKAALGQRLLGAAVIVSLGFIGYSIFLQSDSKKNIDKTAQIPIQTRYVEPLELAAPKGVATVPKEDVDNLFNSQKIVEEPIPDTSTVLNDAGTPNSWIIKVGSFSTEAKSNEVRDQLIELGYKAYVRPIAQSDLHRVLVGPYLGVNELKIDQANIDEILDLETVLLDNEP